MRQIGKYGLKWIRTRHEWIKLNPPNHQGYYKCSISYPVICRGWITSEEMQLDHIKSRTRYPKLRYVLSNLQPSCGPCNEKKGSKEIVKTNKLNPVENQELEDVW